MTKQRQDVPNRLRNDVLNEYNHRCAICGADRPQLHHIDEDPSNNIAENLIPLCPNCHLSDQHNPTIPLAPEKVALFRRYKDPTILSSQFEALFKRIRFLEDIRTPEFDDKVNELLDFVGALNMGQYYSKQLKALIAADELNRRLKAVRDRKEWRQRHGKQYGDRPLMVTASPKDLENDVEEYYATFDTRRDRVYELIVELLRFQSWGRPIHTLYPTDRGR